METLELAGLTVLPQLASGLRIVRVPGPVSWTLFGDDIAARASDALRASGGLVGLETIQARLEADMAELWLALEDEAIAGFAITESIDYLDGTWWNIALGASDRRLAVLLALYDAIEREAALACAAGVKYLSALPGMAALARRRGYAARLVEYVKPLRYTPPDPSDSGELTEQGP